MPKLAADLVKRRVGAAISLQLVDIVAAVAVDGVMHLRQIYSRSHTSWMLQFRYHDGLRNYVVHGARAESDAALTALLFERGKRPTSWHALRISKKQAAVLRHAMETRVSMDYVKG